MGSSNRLKAVLAALERGAVSTEDSLRAALGGPREFARWVEQGREHWKGGPVRRPAVRRARRHPPALAQAAVALARRRFADRPGVVSVHWGLARLEGRSTPEQGIVVTVRSDALRDRAGRPRPFARTLRVPYGQRARVVKVSVQPVAGGGVPHTTRPGRHASVEVGNRTGVLGALVDRDGELHAVLSGHVAWGKGATVGAVAVDNTPVPLGTVQRVVLGDGGDEALAGPVSANQTSLIATAATSVRDLTPNDVNVAIWVHLARDIEPRKVFVTDVGETVPFDYEDGRRRHLPGLIGTSHDVTIGGDSGAPALDFDGNIVGFVVGSYGGRTYLIPARKALENL